MLENHTIRIHRTYFAAFQRRNISDGGLEINFNEAAYLVVGRKQTLHIEPGKSDIPRRVVKFKYLLLCIKEMEDVKMQ